MIQWQNYYVSNALHFLAPLHAGEEFLLDVLFRQQPRKGLFVSEQLKVDAADQRRLHALWVYCYVSAWEEGMPELVLLASSGLSDNTKAMYNLLQVFRPSCSIFDICEDRVVLALSMARRARVVRRTRRPWRTPPTLSWAMSQCAASRTESIHTSSKSVS
jgi:hypothetical protein